MAKTDLRFGVSDADLVLPTLAHYADGWLLDCEIRQHSPQTRKFRRDLLDKLLWFLTENRCETCGTLELRRFLAYVSTGHSSEGGRWGNPHLTQPVRPRTVKDYHGHLRTFFRWVVAEGGLERSPMEPIAAPIARPDQIQPFTDKQVAALLSAAQLGTHRKRDEAIVTLFLDTGLRVSEVCRLTMRDLDLQNKRLTVMGKGNKRRSVPFGRAAARALWAYLREDPREPDSPVFIADRGKRAGEPLTRSGLQQLVERLAQRANLTAVRCSPHTFRHTFAVNFLRNGGNVFTLQQILGHTNLTMTNRYVALAQADVERQHRLYSPMDAMTQGNGRD